VQEATFREVGESGEAEPGQVAERTDAVASNGVPQLGQATAHRRYRNGKRKRHEIVERRGFYDEPERAGRAIVLLDDGGRGRRRDFLDLESGG
jgi:hypothetical protein